MAAAICIALLRSSKPLENALAFTLGYAAVLAAIALAAFVFFGTQPSSGDRSSAIRATIDAAIGVLLLVFALKMWLKTPDPNAPPPVWVAAIDSITPAKALLLGAIVMLTNPTTLALYFFGLKEIVAADPGPAESVVVLAVFIVLVEVEFLVPTAVYAIVPQRASAGSGAAVAGGTQPGHYDLGVRDLRGVVGEGNVRASRVADLAHATLLSRTMPSGRPGW